MVSTALVTVDRLLTLPLHIVAAILGQLDTIGQLRSAIQSHSIFHDALNDNLHSISRNIITNQIPPTTLVLAIALLESTRITPGDYAAVGNLLASLATASSETTLPASASLSFSDYDYLSRNYAAAELLAKKLADEVIPIITDRLGLDRSSSEISAGEASRLIRAFIQYQLMCNLFCLDNDRKNKPTGDDGDLRFRFFWIFSPWANEEMMCVYTYLERKVTEAFDDLVAHDVDWGELPICWNDDANETSHIQWFLCQGLPYLHSVACAKTYSERANIIEQGKFRPRTFEHDPYMQLLYMMPRDSQAEPFGLADVNTSLDSYTPAQLDQLARPSDGAQDSTASSPFRVWLGAHTSGSLIDSVFDPQDRNLWECGYVLWNYTDASMVNI